MQDYLAENWKEIFAHNQLCDFDDFWRVKAAWFEEPNERRGGWSGVARCELKLPGGGVTRVFLKRQENHTTRTLLHPLRGMATFVREMENILRYRHCQVPSLVPAYFAQRKVDGNLRAILITEELAGYRSLEETVRGWPRAGRPSLAERREIMGTVADLLRLMHRHHLQHNCFYPKHIFLKRDASGRLEARVIDLEKTKRVPFAWLAVDRDLGTLNRHAGAWSRADRVRFFKFYRQLDRLTPAAKSLWRKIARRATRKDRRP